MVISFSDTGLKKMVSCILFLRNTSCVSSDWGSFFARLHKWSQDHISCLFHMMLRQSQTVNNILLNWFHKQDGRMFSLTSRHWHWFSNKLLKHDKFVHFHFNLNKFCVKKLLWYFYHVIIVNLQIFTEISN
mgnify:CR=1 FL=1